MSKYPSIFNDVLSPITPGPSSSNTCGPHRIGTIARQLLEGTPKKLTITMAKKGGFFDTFYGMQSDKAFIASVLGYSLLDFNLSLAYQCAHEQDLEYEFSFTEGMPAIPSEMAMITLESDTDKISINAISLGGGEILIDNINGHSVNIDGKHYTVVIEKKGTIEIRKFTVPVTKAVLAEIQAEQPRSRVRYCMPVFPLITELEAKSLFTTSEGMLEYASSHQVPLWQVAIDYEKELTGLSADVIWKTAEETLALSYKSIEEGLGNAPQFEGITTAKAKNMKGPYIPMGPSNQGSIDALAIMESSNAHGTIVCMPTGGSSGIIPAAIKNVSASLNKSHEDEVKALLVAGLIGVFYYPTHYTGAIGCQAEIGVAISMAAAGLTTFLVDDPYAAEKSAVLGMQSVLGMICDPIDGYVQIPCFIRNMTAVPTAITCANAAIGGLDSIVSLDEMVKATMRVGEIIRGANNLGTCMCKKK